MAPFRRRKIETPTPPPELSVWTFKPTNAPPPVDDATRIAAEAGATAWMTARTTPEQRATRLGIKPAVGGFTGTYSGWGGTDASPRARAMREES